MPEPAHLKIALTSNDLTRVDADFLAARQLVFYDLTPDEAQFVDCVQFKDRPRPGGPDGGGKEGGKCCAAGAPAPAIGSGIDARIEALRGASVLFTLSMSDPQAVRVADLGVFPIKLAGERSICEVLDRLQEMLKGDPPLWLKRALRHGPVTVVA